MKLLNNVLLLIMLLCFNMNVNAQVDSKEQQEIMKPINFLFEGMEKADTTIIKKAFAKNVIMKVVSEKGAKKESLDNFLKQIANKKPGTPKWLEKLFNTEIRMDGHLAHVWTEYSFYVGDKFSHCGVDSFALIKLDGEWRIVYIMDTRRRDNCENQ